MRERKCRDTDPGVAKGPQRLNFYILFISIAHDTFFIIKIIFFVTNPIPNY